MFKLNLMTEGLEHKQDESDIIVYPDDDMGRPVIHQESVENRHLDPRFKGKSPMEIATYFSTLDPRNCKLT